MRKFFVLLLCLSASFGFNMAQTCGKGIKVLQLNLWGGTSKVSDGYQGFLDLLEEVDPDIVFLCEISGGQRFVHRVIQDMKQRGKLYYGEAFDLAVGFLSKIHPEKVQKLCTVPGNEERTMVKFLVAAGGKEVAFYSCHLDHRHYECYMPRGYSGTTWKKIDKPVTDEQAVLAANRLAYRDESVAAFLEEARKDIACGREVIIGGDFNEPSCLDWQDSTRHLWDHNGAVIHWDCSRMLLDAGFRDAYREKHPDPVRFPGFTFPAGNRHALDRLSWAPDADERDRIDFIYYYPACSSLKLQKCVLVGPRETVLRGRIEENGSEDPIWVPACVWPSDHKGNLAIFAFAGCSR